MLFKTTNTKICKEWFRYGTVMKIHKEDKILLILFVYVFRDFNRKVFMSLHFVILLCRDLEEPFVWVLKDMTVGVYRPDVCH